MVSALLQGVPAEVLTHGGNTTCTSVVSFDTSDSSPSYHLELVFVCFGVRGPNCSGVFKSSPNKCLVG